MVAGAGLEAEVICTHASSSTAEKVFIQLPFQDIRFVHHTNVVESDSLTFIVPLKGRSEALARFLNNILQVNRVGTLQIILVVVYFEDDNAQKVAAALNAVEGANILTQLILLKGEFSRSRALQIGVERAKGFGAVVFLCDVDMVITWDFLLRCLITPIQGRQVGTYH